MSEAVVDDIVAVLPPLLQSLEALSFVARHLNPPDFDRVMQAAGTPEETLQAARARLAEWPQRICRCARQRSRPRAMRRWRPLPACAPCNMARAISSRVFRALRYAPRAHGSALSAGGKISAGERLLSRSCPARRRGPQGAAGAAGLPTTPASCTITTSPAAAAASRSMCRNIIRPIAPGRW